MVGRLARAGVTANRSPCGGGHLRCLWAAIFAVGAAPAMPSSDCPRAELLVPHGLNGMDGMLSRDYGQQSRSVSSSRSRRCIYDDALTCPLLVLPRLDAPFAVGSALP